MFSKPLPERGSLWRLVLEEYSKHDVVANEKVKVTVAKNVAKSLGLFDELESHKNEKGLPRNQLAYNIGFYEIPSLRKRGLIEYLQPRGCGKITQKGKDFLAKSAK